MTLANAPLSGRDGLGYALICDFGKSEYFFKDGLTTNAHGHDGDLPVEAR
jgi:hypothetical protein